MSDSRQIVLPKALYLDANALVAAPKDLVTQPLAEIAEIANRFHMGLFVPQLAAEEWIARCCADAAKLMNRLRGDARQLGTLLNREPLDVEDIVESELRTAVRDVQAQRLVDIGFQTIPTPDVDLDGLIQLFLAKTPPFSDGDKGFKDAIILEAIVQHACKDNRLDHVIIASGDRIFGHAAIARRFAEAGTTVHIAGGDPKDVLAGTVGMLKSMIDDAGRELMTRYFEKTMAFAQGHEREVFDFVLEHATLSMSLLKGLTRGQERDLDDRKLDYSRIVSIDVIRPKTITTAFVFRGFPKDRSDGRVTMHIHVAIEIDVTIDTPTLFAEPRVPLTNAQSLLDAQDGWRSPRKEETLTVTRSISVRGSVAAEGVSAGDFTDLRLEEVW